MDNLTHSLFGAAVAEAYIQTKIPSAPKGTRRLLYTTSILANNCPDFDFILGLVDNTSLGYLLNHRGWTHTVIGAFLQSLLLVALFYSVLNWRRSPLKASLKHVGALALVGCQTHMLLDFFNSYGVHPFWPWDTSWFYLDSVFIIEPLLWIVLYALWLRPTGWANLLLIPIVLAYAFGFYRDLVPPAALIAPSLLLLLCCGLYKKLSAKPKSLLALSLFTAIVVIFWGHQKLARHQVLAQLSLSSSAQTLDVVLTSLPSNPTCWFFLAPQLAESNYQVLAGSVALYGSAQDCRTWSMGKSLPSNFTAPNSSSAVHFRGAWVAPLEELRPLLKNCQVTSWFKFARVPFWNQRVLNDLRFAVRDEQNFTTLKLQSLSDDTCPPIAAPWSSPRQDVLDAVQRLPEKPKTL